MASSPRWPAVPDEHRWVLDLLEEQFRSTRQTPEELLARAKELRREADETDVKGFRDAATALAARYEELAAARLAST